MLNIFRGFFLLLTATTLSQLPTHSTLAQDEVFPFVAESTADNVNVRSGQSENFEKLYQLKIGEEVLVLGRSFSWYKIELPQQAGIFVSAEFVNLLDSRNGEITGHRVNLRSGPGTNHSIVGQMKEGDLVKIKDVDNDWYEIKPIDGTVGWVMEDYLAFKTYDLTRIPVEEEFNGALLEKGADADRSETTSKNKIKEESIGKDPGDNLPIEKALVNNNTLVIGHLQYQEYGGGTFILMVDDEPVYRIQGLKPILQEFVGYKVTIEGKIRPQIQNASEIPTLELSKIELIL
ncbi:MAG: SH3 domain-containing protein [Candidatus Omnitrophica bacterium]|nr:SH3 domain-containing protein [Candidatus Omnitrophota bacterium]